MRFTARTATLAICATLLSPALAEAATGDHLDRARLGAVLFADDFRHGLSLDPGCNSKTARYVTQYCGEGDPDSPYSRTHAEHQCYSDEKFDGIDPFEKDPVRGIRIKADHLPAALAKRCNGAKYSSGMLSTRNSFRMTHGYWEVEAQMPSGGQGRWPALWLKASSWPPEIDFAEFAQGVINGAQHSALHPNGVGGTGPQFGCLCDQPHRFGFLNTGDEMIWYVDGVEWYRAKPDPGVGDANYYLIINLAVSGRPGGWTGGETATSVPTSMRVLDIKAYALK